EQCNRVFFYDIDRVKKVAENGTVINNELIRVFPLSSPAKKVILSNVPVFITDKEIHKKLSRFGRVVSPIRKLFLGCSSPMVKNLYSFRRMAFMVFKDGTEELNTVFKFRSEGYDYSIFVTSDTEMKCFNCGKMGHLVRACPDKHSDTGVS
ncbi:ubiquitin-conjugating enzyme E2 variant 3 isoform X3, partial [Silurus meridionalis]